MQFVEKELAVPKGTGEDSPAGGGLPRGGGPRLLFPHLPHFYYGVVLRVAGREREATEHIARAEELLRIMGLKARLHVLREQQARLVEVLRHASSHA